MSNWSDWPFVVGTIASQAGDSRDDIGGQQRRVAGPLAIQARQLHDRGLEKCRATPPGQSSTTTGFSPAAKIGFGAS